MVAGLKGIYVAQRKRDEQARSLLGEALSRILRERDDAEEELSKKLEALRTKIREAIRPALTNLKQASGMRTVGRCEAGTEPLECSDVLKREYGDMRRVL